MSNSGVALLISSLILIVPAASCASIECNTDKDCGEGWTCLEQQCLQVVESSVALPGVECALPSPGQLVLNEILANPSGTDVNLDGTVDYFQDEFIEVLNLAPHPINVGGIRLIIGTGVRHTFEPTCLASGHAIVMFGGGVPQTTGAEFTVISDQPMRLSNNGASVELRDSQDRTLDSIVYGKEANGTGSLTRNPDGTGSWMIHPPMAANQYVTHSAGRCNNGSFFPECKTLPNAATSPETEGRLCENLSKEEFIINEILADPGGYDANGDGLPIRTHDEFVELVLATSSSRNLAGISLKINGHTRLLFDDGCVKGGSAYVVFGSGVQIADQINGANVAVSAKSLGLSNTSGVVTIERDNTVLSSVVYGSEAGHNQSITRFPDVVGQFVRHSEAAVGPPASPGQCVDGSELISGCWHHGEFN